MKELKNAFGRAPESFKYSVAGALYDIKREEKKSTKIRRPLIVLVAALTLLLAGLVYAAVSEYRLANFYEDRYDVEIKPEVQEQMVADIPADTVQVGPLLLRVQEVYLEEGTLYASANVSSADGTPAYFMSTDIGPNDRVDEFFQENRGTDSRSYLQAAKEDGRKLYYVSFYATVQDADGGGMLDYTILPDGSATFVSAGMVEGLPQGQETATVEYLLIVTQVDTQTGEYLEEERIRYTFQEEIPVHRSEEGEGFLVDQIFANSSIRLDEIVFRQTALGISCDMYCSPVEGGEGPMLSDENDLWLTLVDAQGEYLDSSPGEDTRESLGDGRWLVSRSMKWTTPPASGEGMYIKLYDVMTKDTYDIMQVTVP